MNHLLPLLTRFGTLVILAILCIGFSIATLNKFHPTQASDGRQLAHAIAEQYPNANVLVVTRDTEIDAFYGEAIEETLSKRDVKVVEVVSGAPVDVRTRLLELASENEQVDLIATHYYCASWLFLKPAKVSALRKEHTALADLVVVTPRSYTWPMFLSRDNLLTVLNLIAVTAIVAIGMTLVIITGGIDLSVGSLIALATVTASCVFAWSSKGGQVPVGGLVLGVLAAVAVAGMLGLVSGGLVTGFKLPPFIVTLGMMSIARGLAYKFAGGAEPVNFDSDLFHRLESGRDLFGIPNPVVIAAVLYIIAHLVMTRTTLGRFIYAIGGNAEAARLSGVPVQRVLLLVYGVCGAACALGGLIYASKYDNGPPNIGQGDELLIIAAVVVGGTSLAGGEGKVMGTLVGALILAVISNGMLLLKVDTFSQMIVFGLLILGASIIDRLKLRSWKRG